jgi:transposase
MYLRASRQRRADGSELVHLQLAESYWDKSAKKSRTRLIQNIGRAEDPSTLDRLKRLVRSIQRHLDLDALPSTTGGLRVVDVREYGDVYVLDALWRRLRIPEAIERALAGRRIVLPVERALFAMVANRCCAPASKLYCWEQWLAEDALVDGGDELALHHLYRAMDVLVEAQEDIEREVFFSVASLLRLDVELVFYDTTSLHFEVDQPDEDGESGPGLRKRGFSKNGRSDAPQVVVGLAVTRDGFPVRHWVFPGNTVDVSTVSQVRAELSGWQLSRCVFVGDAGMVSQANLRELSRGGGRYIVCVPVNKGGDIDRQVVSRAGRYRRVADNLRVKEVTLGDGERRQRYAVCHNPEQEARQRQHREALLRTLEAELASLRPDSDGHSKRECALRTSARYGRYLRTDKRGRLHISRAKVREAARMDGKFVVTTNDDTLTAEDMALGYKQLQRAEQAWRRMKSGLRLRPVYHRLEHRIRAHIAINVLALLLERVAEQACGDTWRNIHDDIRQIKAVALSGPDGEVLQTSEPSTAAQKRLEQLDVRPPPLVLRVR